MGRHAKSPPTRYGTSVRQALAEAQSTQTALAGSVGTSVSYVNRTLTGAASPSPEWIDTVADALNVSDDMRVTMHRSAAMDAGYKLDLDLTVPTYKPKRRS